MVFPLAGLTVAMVMALTYYLFSMSAIQTLLRGSIDYAGLFPPAGLDMASAVSNYAQYLAGPSAWALGRFVVPVSRLSEFEAAAERHLPPHPADQPWHLSALLGTDLSADIARLDQFNRRHTEPSAPAVMADSVELKADSVEAIEDIGGRLPSHLQAYIEVPIDRDPSSLLNAVSRVGAHAKVRTGGVTKDSFPSTPDLLRFLQGCIRAAVPFKATAGLHHPLRAEYRLTYAPDSGCGTMFGFLNVFLAAACLRAGMSEADAAQLLEEGSPGAFQVDGGGISWRNHRLSLPDIRKAREKAVTSFGSCSFDEPINELASIHLLAPTVSQA
jgi:hypothetical protein